MTTHGAGGEGGRPPSEQRGSQRIDARIAVEVQVGSERREAISRNISVTGIFVETAAAKVGTRVHVRFALPKRLGVIDADAEVRWVEPDGMGLRFLGLRAQQVWALGKFIGQMGQVGSTS